MNVGEMQRKLSQWATQDKEMKFFDLYHLLYDEEWLRLAHDRVALKHPLSWWPQPPVARAPCSPRPTPAGVFGWI